jgi:hypothetical protein
VTGYDGLTINCQKGAARIGGFHIPPSYGSELLKRQRDTRHFVPVTRASPTRHRGQR